MTTLTHYEDACLAVSHIYTFEVATTDGDIKHVLSTKAKIKEFPLFDEVITVNDVNAEIVWLSDEDETLYDIAAHAFHNRLMDSGCIYCTATEQCEECL